MRSEGLELTIKAKTRIKKYHEGADPTTDAPFEVVENETTLVGTEAHNYLKKLGVIKEEN